MMAKYCKKENVENSNSHDKPVVASGTVYKLDSKTFARLITYFGNFVFCILVIEDDQNHLLCLFTYSFYKARQAKGKFKKINKITQLK